MPQTAQQETPMLTKLRRKFVFTNMLFVVLILAVVWVLMVVVGMNQGYNEMNDSLNKRVEMVSSQPMSGQRAGFAAGGFEGQMPDEDFDADDLPYEDVDDLLSPEDGMFPRRMEDDQLIATSVYVVKSDGTIVQTVENPLNLDDDSTAAAIQAALAAYQGSAEGHVLGSAQDLGLRYAVQGYAMQSDTVVIALASEQYINQSLMSTVQSLGIASVIALVAFFVLSLFLSRWALGPVQRAWNQQQQFIADASHELKTPLTVIMANNSILMSKPEATVAEQMQWVESTQTEAKLMQGLVNDMLYLARSEGDEQELVLEQVDLSDLARGASLQFEAVAFEQGIVLDDDIADGIQVRGNADQLGRLIAILVDNACKYCGDGGEVKILLDQAGGKARIRVHNTGAPIDPEDLPHLFDRFYRADKARTRGKGGFGLGLSIAYNIVTAHRGTIEAASTAADGTTFTVLLPL